jgi:hypothetical protein
MDIVVQKDPSIMPEDQRRSAGSAIRISDRQPVGLRCLQGRRLEVEVLDRLTRADASLPWRLLPGQCPFRCSRSIGLASLCCSVSRTVLREQDPRFL